MKAVLVPLLAAVLVTPVHAADLISAAAPEPQPVAAPGWTLLTRRILCCVGHRDVEADRRLIGGSWGCAH